MPASVLLASVVTVVIGFTPTKDENMNGEYRLSNLPPGSNFSTNFKDYPGSSPPTLLETCL